MAGIDDPLYAKSHFGQHMGYQQQSNEIELYDNATAEYFAIYGIPIDYYPVIADPNKDPVFGEDTNKSYLRKVKLTCYIDEEGFDEQLLYTGFGELNNIDFKIFIHLPTFIKQINRKPIVGDQFYLPHNSSFVYEVSHSIHAALGRPGNIFGFKSCWVLNARQREVSSTDAGYAERYGVVDSQGNLRADAPADALVSDGSGRVADKYKVEQPVVSPNATHDNDAIKLLSDGKIDPSTGQPEGGIVIPRDRSAWGDW